MMDPSAAERIRRMERGEYPFAQACPLCRPDLFDADLATVPAALFCATHQDNPIAKEWRRRKMLQNL